MNSKEALKSLENLLKDLPYAINYKKQHDIIMQDLEHLEKENKLLNETKNSVDKVLEDLGKINEENTRLKKAIEILKDKLELPLENDFDVVNKDDILLYRLRIKALINEQEYELLKEVLENDK